MFWHQEGTSYPLDITTETHTHSPMHTDRHIWCLYILIVTSMVEIAIWCKLHTSRAV